MARPKQQERRRRELLEAAQRTVAKHGPDGALLQRVAEEAGLTPGAVLYYYPHVQDLILDANRAGLERFYERRLEQIQQMKDDPISTLGALISSGLPGDSDDDEVRLLCELGGSAGRNPVVAALLTTLFDRQVSMYQVVIEHGKAMGVFASGVDSLSVARNLVALEDAYGYRIVAGHPSITAPVAAQLIADHASQAVGCTIAPQFSS